MQPWSNETSLSAGDNELMAPWGYNLAASVLIFNQGFGSLLNFAVIVFMCKHSQIWNPLNIILFNLVCSDFAVSILGNPFALMSALSHRWYFGELGCQCYAFLMAFLGINAITTMAVMAVDRYFLVTKPFSSKQLNNKGAKLTVIFIWMYAAIVTCPPFFGWGAFVPEAANISCSVNWEEKSTNATSYILFIFFFGLAVPLVVIVFSYINIVLTMKRSASKLNRTSASENKVIKMVFLMILAFMTAWSPYAIFALFKQFGNGALITPGMGVIPSIFAKTSIVYNPIIYVYMNSQFRQAFERFRGKKTTPRMMTVSTTANMDDGEEVRQTMRERIRNANIDDEHVGEVFVPIELEVLPTTSNVRVEFEVEYEQTL